MCITWNHGLSYAFAAIFQNVKAVFDAAIKVVLQPPKSKKKGKKKNTPCVFL